MHPETVPIAQYVAQKFSSHQIQKVIENWRIEHEILINKLVEHFREMGIFQVAWGLEQLMISNMIYQLRNSPDILNLVNKAKINELKRQRSRHSE